MVEDADRPFYDAFWHDSQYQLRYAFDAAVRDRFPALQSVWGSLATPRRVLDFGSGNGVLTYWLRQNGFGDEIIGVDVSATGTAYATQNFADERLSFRQIEPGASLEDLGTFDALVSSHVLEHLEDPVGILRSLRPLAKWFVLEVPLESAIVPNATWALRGKDRKTNPVGHVQFWNAETFRRTVEDAGFMIVRDYRYASAPFSPFSGSGKKLVQRILLKGVGVAMYGRLFSTHYAVLARAA
jgi:SAM-dependent methyltransferase